MIDPDMRHAWLALAAAAGSITALSTMPWKAMSWPERALTLIVGFFFAYFLGPVIAEYMFGIKNDNMGAICGTTYVAGSASNILLPIIIKWGKGTAERISGSEEKA